MEEEREEQEKRKEQEREETESWPSEQGGLFGGRNEFILRVKL